MKLPEKVSLEMSQEQLYQRYQRAARIIDAMLDSPPQTFLRQADDSGVLEEFEYLCEELRAWLDDADYLDELAWEQSQKIA